MSRKYLDIFVCRCKGTEREAGCIAGEPSKKGPVAAKVVGMDWNGTGLPSPADILTQIPPVPSQPVAPITPTQEVTSIPTQEATSAPTTEAVSSIPAAVSSIPRTEAVTSIPIPEAVTSIPAAEAASIPTTEVNSIQTSEVPSIPSLSETAQIITDIVDRPAEATPRDGDTASVETTSTGKNYCMFYFFILRDVF